MQCPKCGADNKESAEFCSLCMQRLREGPPAAAPTGAAGKPPGTPYVSPADWREGLETLSVPTGKRVEESARRFRRRMAIYGMILIAVVAWLALSFTVWRNPSPGKRSAQLIEAVNARSPDAFLELFQPQDQSAADDLYADILFYLGSTGKYVNIELGVVQDDVYTYLESGTVIKGGDTTVSLSRSDNLVIALENRRGSWYVVPRGTDLIP